MAAQQRLLGRCSTAQGVALQLRPEQIDFHPDEAMAPSAVHEPPAPPGAPGHGQSSAGRARARLPPPAPAGWRERRTRPTRSGGAAKRAWPGSAPRRGAGSAERQDVNGTGDRSSPRGPVAGPAPAAPNTGWSTTRPRSAGPRPAGGRLGAPPRPTHAARLRARFLVIRTPGEGFFLQGT